MRRGTDFCTVAIRGTAGWDSGELPARAGFGQGHINRGLTRRLCRRRSSRTLCIRCRARMIDPRGCYRSGQRTSCGRDSSRPKHTWQHPHQFDPAVVLGFGPKRRHCHFLRLTTEMKGLTGCESRRDVNRRDLLGLGLVGVLAFGHGCGGESGAGRRRLIPPPKAHPNPLRPRFRRGNKKAEKGRSRRLRQPDNSRQLPTRDGSAHFVAALRFSVFLQPTGFVRLLVSCAVIIRRPRRPMVIDALYFS